MVCLSCDAPHVHIPISEVDQGVAYGYDYTVGNHCIRLIDMGKSLCSRQHFKESMQLLCEIDPVGANELRDTQIRKPARHINAFSCLLGTSSIGDWL
jgi:hypothetical protein